MLGMVLFLWGERSNLCAGKRALSSAAEWLASRGLQRSLPAALPRFYSTNGVQVGYCRMELVVY